MKLIKLVPGGCDCLSKLERFDDHEVEQTGCGFGEGTQVECDCGSRYRKGKITWIRMSWREVGT